MVAKIYFFHRPQSDRDPVWALRPCLPLLRILPDDDDAVATSVSRPGDAGDRQMAAVHFRGRFDAGRKNDGGFLQLVRRDARHNHDLSWCCAVGVRRIRKFCRAAANRRARHDVPKSQRGEFLGVRGWRRDHAGQFLRAWRRGQGRLDILYTAGGFRRYRAWT